MKSFRGYLHRWYASATRVAPFTAARILPVLRNSAEATVKVCTGGFRARQCGFSWAVGVFDGDVGAGQQMNALSAVSSLLIRKAEDTVTDDTGGTSSGDPNAGAGSNDEFKVEAKPVTTSDKVGAAFVTVG